MVASKIYLSNIFQQHLAFIVNSPKMSIINFLCLAHFSKSVLTLISEFVSSLQEFCLPNTFKGPTQHFFIIYVFI